MEMTELQDKWRQARDLICAGGVSTHSLMSAMFRIGEEQMRDIYENGHNLLHHAIAKNNVDLIELIFEFMFFLLPHQSSTVPYLHLASMCGSEDVISVLVANRPSDLNVRVSIEDQGWKDVVAYQGLEAEDLNKRLASMVGEDKTISALEVAAVYLQRSCLLRLMNCQGISTEDLLTSMTDTGLSPMIGNLIAAKDYEAVNFDLKEALRIMSPMHLEKALRDAADHKIELDIANPYHLMFTTGNWGPTDEPVECTKMLVDHGWDINALIASSSLLISPPSPFAMYALIHQILRYDGKDVDDRLACLKILLESGGDPNFFEQSQNCYSAAHAVVDVFGINSINQGFLHRMCETLRVLFKNGCDFSITDTLGQSVLHKLLPKIASAFSENCGNDVSRVVGSLILYGADISSRDHNGHATPLVDFSADLSFWLGEIRPLTFNIEMARVVYRFLHIMEQDEARVAVKECLEYIEMSCEEQYFNEVPQEVQKELKQELVSYLEHFRSLEHQCLVKVWRYCGHNLANFNQLPLTVVVKNSLMEMFACCEG